MVHADGIYRVSYNQLLTAGVPADQIDPRNIQLFYQGEEQYIYIKGEGSSGIFDPDSYIEFYARRNRAGIDSLVYLTPSEMVNPDHSLFTDTSAYFLTWNTSTTNRRLQLETDVNFAAYTANQPAYIWRTVRINYTTTYVKGSTRCIYGDGEGWFDSEIFRNHHPDGDLVVDKTIPTPQVHYGGPPTTLQTAVVGYAASKPDNYYPHHLKVSVSGNVIIEKLFTGYEHALGNATLNTSSLGTQLVLRYTANDETVPDVPDQMVVSFVSLRYPHTLNLENTGYFEFEVPVGSGAKQLVSLSGLSTSDNNNVVFYDLSNHRRITVQYQSAAWKLLLPETGETRRCVIASSESILQVDAIRRVSSTDRFTDYQAAYPAAEFLMVAHESVWTSAQQYATYRSAQGNSVALADISQLYDQFAYGVQKHPLSVTNFCNYMVPEGSPHQAFLFLFGKSVNSADMRNSATNYAKCMVPSFGYPASDNLFTTAAGGTAFAPRLATGRICVNNNAEGQLYLAKVIEHESNLPAEWMKNVLHFGGGATTSEQSSFANYLASYENIIEDTLFGAYVSTFLKNSSTPVQITLSDSVAGLINHGVSLMTFFGHASAGGFDQSIDNPENYTNQGRYPFVLANSCFAGDIHLAASQSTSEDWVLTANRGAIAFLASVGEGIPNYLNLFSTNLYQEMASQSYGQPFGLQIKKTIETIQEGNLDNVRLEITCHEFTLHGDPLLAVNAFDLPDLTPKVSDIAFFPNEISTAIDSFDVRIVITNIGRATHEDFTVTVKRTYADNSETEHIVGLQGCLYRDTIVLTLPVDLIKGPGMNHISIYADAMNSVNELNEVNNFAGLDFLIRSSDLIPVWPHEFAIVPDNQISLIASTGDPFLQPALYLFQLDTTDTFNSVAGNPLHEYSVTAPGGIISWQLPFQLTDSTVYYWRIARHHNIADSIIWKESSFIYIPGKEGWSQAHFYQFKNDDYRFVEYNRPQQQFDFSLIARLLQVYNQRYVGSSTYSDVRFTIDGAVNNGFGDHGCCGNRPAVMVAVIDPVSLLAWPSDIHDYGHRNYPECGSSGRPNYYFVFSSGFGNEFYEQDIQNMYAMLHDVPDGNYILVYSWTNAYFEQWPENVLAGFEALGAVNIRNISNSQAYIFFTRKGFSSYSQEWYSNAETPACHAEIKLYTDFYYGNISSKIIGPASQWNSFHWNAENMESPSYDSVSLSITGLDVTGNEHLLIDAIQPGTYDVYNLGEQIDYQQYPYLKLDFYTRDDTAKTPAQLVKWQLTYDGVPETALNPADGFSFCCDTLDEGDEMVFAIATRNLSHYPMDSLLVKYWVVNSNNEYIPVSQKRLRPHPAGDVIVDTVRLSTLGMSGLNSIWVEYNPVVETTGAYDQPEQYHFNNIAQKFFYVLTDNVNPLLDVAFDGVHIMDGDLISARPEILISLKDENKYLELNDTSVFRIYLTDLSSGIERRIYFGAAAADYTMNWVPAELPDNSCKIYFNPIFTNDGQYRLRIQATDMSGNESGSYDYAISFEVITASSITNMLNYPNPFSTSTRFVFELTGSEIPDDFSIEIFTVTGKLVKVIDLAELGGIHIGRNITDYAWDGTDMYGDRLANGVYFYRVKARINRQSVDHRQSGADAYWKHETGKMYLLR
mgnify:CR=1 FL=1